MYKVVFVVILSYTSLVIIGTPWIFFYNLHNILNIYIWLDIIIYI